MSSVSGIRLPGLATGMDTETMVKEMLTGEQNKVDKAKQKEQIINWQQETYREMISDIKGFNDKYFSLTSKDSIINSSAWNTLTVTSSNSSVITATGNAGANKVDYNFEVKKLAEPAKAQSSLSDLKKDSKLVELGATDGEKFKNAINKNLKIKFTNNKILVASSDAGDFVESSSWGPTPSLDFKPQISAPGGNIYSTINDNKYGIKTGTSMAAPHVAGGETLIVEGLKKENPNLKGRDLVELAKNTAISTSKIEMDKNNPKIPYSPRRQGAGLMQIEEALKNKVVVLDENNNSTVALKQIGNEKEFTLTLKNYGDKEAEYDVENLGGV